MQLDEYGHLCPGQNWDKDVSRKLAETIGVTLTDCLWQATVALREYCLTAERIPTQIVLVRMLRQVWNIPELDTLYLRQKFPQGALRQLSCLAGLPLPDDCLTAAERFKKLS